ncbi:MAG: (d)CMP kinase [Thermoplasmata archaeon]
MSGLPGSGTTTASRLLAERTSMEVISSGEVFREMAQERDMDLEEFSELAERDEEIDRSVDERMLEKAEEGKILEARLTGHLLSRSDKDAFKVWLEAPLDVRVERIAEREEENSEEEVKKRVKKRERSERKRYLEYYDIDLKDTSVYDMLIDSHEHNPDEIVDKIIERIGDEIC